MTSGRRGIMVFRARIRVRFGDIDYAGIVYYPRFLHYFHVALEEFFEAEVGIDYPTILNRHRLGFPTVRLETDFRRSLRYGDLIDVEIRVLRIGRTSVTWGYKGYIGKDLAVEGQNVTVSMNMDTFKKTETPSWFIQGLEAYQKRCEKRTEG
jgi:4-hydroxybenzoyl-CoA thioesterase